MVPDATGKASRGYLDTPSMGLPTSATVDAVGQALGAWHRGQARYGDWEAAMQRSRELFARLVAVRAEDVALLPAVGPAITAAASALATRGGMVVIHRREFRSLLLPVLARLGEDRIQWVEGPYVAATFTGAITNETVGVLVSSTSSHDGARPSLATITEAAWGVGAEVVVDATQECGIVPSEVAVERLSVYATAGYKGLRAPRGCAFAYIRSDLVNEFWSYSPYGMADEQLRGAYGPPIEPKPGAPSLDQSPAWFSWVGAEPALRDQLGTDPRALQEHVLGLSGRLRDELHLLGLAPQETDLPSPIVSFDVEDAPALAAFLESRGVRSAARADRLRLGFHGYNDVEDIGLVVAALSEWRGTGSR